VAISAAIAMILGVFMSILSAFQCDPRSDRNAAEFFREELRLFTGRDVPTLVDLVELDEVAIGALRQISADTCLLREGG
jgi:hypothetical protein